MAQTPAKKTTPAAKAAPSPAGPPEDAAAQAERERLDREKAEREQAQADQAEKERVTEQASMGRTEARREADTKEEKAAASNVCVVSDGSPHTGYALPGKKICSAHEMHYLPDGTPRVKAHAAAQREALKPGGGTIVDHPGA